MWKRFNRPSERAIGNPTLVETTLDESTVEGLTSLTNGEFSISARPAFGRKGTKDVVKDLPDLPVKVEQSLQPPASRPYSIGSSVYSQATQDRRNKQPRLTIPRASSVYPDDVSPPDSPRTADGARSKKSSPNVSPITDGGSIHHSLPAIPRPYISNIPLPRAPQPTSGEASVSGWREKVGRGDSPADDSKLTRWDDYSGEPTNSETGKPAQVIPGTANLEQQFGKGAQNGGYGNSINITSPGEGSKSLFSDRVRKITRKETNEVPAAREEWKGASRGSPIMKPVTDNPRPPGKVITPHVKGSLKHTVGLRPRPTPGRTSPGGRTSPAVANGVVSNSRVKVVHEAGEPMDDPSMRPVVPLKVNKNGSHTPTTRTPISANSTPASTHNILYSIYNPDSEMNSPSSRKPSAADSVMLTGNKQSTLPNIPKTDSLLNNTSEEGSADITESQIAAAAQIMNILNEPGSRFSATTYNTTIPDSTPGSPRRSLDSPPPLPTPQPSILNRKRPVPTTGVTIAIAEKPPSRKPTPSQVESGTLKSLPQPPPDTTALDRVALLQAKLDSLNRRRGNLQTVIHELTHVVQPSSIAYDIASRQEIKKTVEGLNTESAAVAKEIHETGLKLHRAMKRRDDEFEPTALWVRRVTE